MNKPTSSPSKGISPLLKYMTTVGCGVVVANLYYCQPLLGAMARTFQVSEASASFINIFSQLGYGLGLFLVVPLGDMLERRQMLIWMHLLAAISLLGAALSPGIMWMYVFSICIGITSTACQIFIPLAAHLASDEERGNVLGVIMGGLLTGILLSRTLSGFAADYLGWRSMYFIAAGLMLVMTLLVSKFIPGERPAFKGTYRELMNSLLHFFRTEKALRDSAWIGACAFGAIAAFWATMAFFLENPPFSYPLSVIGLFGVIGLAGALVSPRIGKIVDKSGPVKPMQWGIVLMLVGYLVLFEGEMSIVLVIIGIILIDIGVQATHVPNLSRVYALIPEARTRLNTIYMTSFFIGGTLGSVIGSLAWNVAGWTGVCIVGLVMVILGGVRVFLKRWR